jgi:hypothetical protein
MTPQRYTLPWNDRVALNPVKPKALKKNQYMFTSLRYLVTYLNDIWPAYIYKKKIEQLDTRRHTGQYR